jgi:two-component system, chemotaxis family, sensor kinase CheA
MGDGRAALILDVLGIGQNSGVLADSREPARAAAEQPVQAGAEKQRLLLFRAGSFERVAVPLSLVARLEEFPLPSIERAGGSLVVQYRGRILPLIPLRDVLEPDARACDVTADPVQVIVVKDGERSVGIIVDHIVDVAEEAITIRQKSVRKGLLGSAVIGKKVTDVVDLNQVINQAAGAWTQGSSGLPNDKIILLAEASAFSRGLLRSGLDMAGYAVLEAASLEDAIGLLEKHPVDVVIASLDLPHDGSPALLQCGTGPNGKAFQFWRWRILPNKRQPICHRVSRTV